VFTGAGGALSLLLYGSFEFSKFRVKVVGDHHRNARNSRLLDFRTRSPWPFEESGENDREPPGKEIDNCVRWYACSLAPKTRRRTLRFALAIVIPLWHLGFACALEPSLVRFSSFYRVRLTIPSLPRHLLLSLQGLGYCAGLIVEDSFGLDAVACTGCRVWTVEDFGHWGFHTQVLVLWRI